MNSVIGNVTYEYMQVFGFNTLFSCEIMIVIANFFLDVLIVFALIFN